MKFTGFCLRRDNKSGIILIVVLWVLAILSVLAIGLGRGARIDLGLARHVVGKLKAEGLVQAAVTYAQNQISLKADKEATKPLVGDTLYQCGFYLPEGKTSEDLFKNVSLKDGSFDISYVLEDRLGKKEICYGFQDEERRINVNGITRENQGILVNLFLLLNVPEEQATALAGEIVSWSLGPESVGSGAGEGDDIGKVQSLEHKGLPFQNIEELLLVKGMTEDIFKKVKDYLTVFPQDGAGVNINTASEIVLRALFRFVVEKDTNYEMTAADNVARAILLYRQGDDGRSCTFDDRVIEDAKIGEFLSSGSEQSIYNGLSNKVQNSQYFRVHIQGRDKQYGVSSRVETVINKDSILFWKRQ